MEQSIKGCSIYVLYNGLPVCAMRERVNRYNLNSRCMLTASATYGKMFLNRKGCVRRWRLRERFAGKVVLGVWLRSVSCGGFYRKARLGEGK